MYPEEIAIVRSPANLKIESDHGLARHSGSSSSNLRYSEGRDQEITV
jgi:hypothetical protein